jgi:V/A-type H+-transporting ATPase subunit C
MGEFMKKIGVVALAWCHRKIKNSIKIIVNDKTLDPNIADKTFLPETKSLLQIFIDVEKNKIPELLKQNGFNEEIIKSVSEEEINHLKMDIAFDKFIIEKLRSVKVPYKCESPKQRFLNILIDITNIRNLLRAKQIGYSEESCLNLFIGEGQEIPFWKFKEIATAELVPQAVSALDGTSYYHALKDTIEDYNKEKSVQALESSLEERFLALVKNISINNYVTIGPTLRFLVNKEYEIRNLKAIVKGIGENIQSETP